MLLIALPTAVYTMFGGVQAVTWTDVKQMVLIVVGLVAAVVVLVLGLPDGRRRRRRRCSSPAPTGRLQTFDFSFDLTNQYTFWSGTIAALFLFCSYFGTDQSQVQRYLTTQSVDEARESLLMSAYWKIPLQALVLLVGVLMFVFYVFTPAPMLFNTRARARAARRAARRRSTRRSSSASRRRRRRERRRPPAMARARGRRRRRSCCGRGAASSRRARPRSRAIRGEALALVRETHRRRRATTT